ncbi:uncharacterized protein LOC107818171 isoform X2 [Nicotiana tabacum]|uniref:Uncharacterized protein LOC107818171 isoform X2 n=1 Tax=Nicotiana tabacum TaxID=4097 RepID=A0A1S4CF61_TOBAC|nr:PREDICTED: uncharacterized protein LOC107818171 isoform X2 [Nicotiana tabacum]
MEKRFNRNLSNESRGSSKSLQKIIAESKRPSTHVPDLTDFMNDMFFGTPSPDKKAYNLKGISTNLMDDEDNFDSSTRSVSSRLTQEWLQEAKQMVASSPGRGSESPPRRLVVSPRFATSHARIADSPTEGRDPLSRSARRSVVGFSEEILSKTAKHNRNKSEPFNPPSTGTSPASNVQDWFSNIFKPPNDGPTAGTTEPTSPKPNNEQQQPALTLPPRQSNSRRTRFHTNSNAPQPQSIHSPKRSFKIPVTGSTDSGSHCLDDKPLSPPKNLVESSHRRSISSTTCSIPDERILSPPRNLVESAHRRTISASTCSFDKVLRKNINNVDRDEVKEEDLKSQELNRFLKDQRDKINSIFNGELKGKAKIVLSGPSNSTSSMVAAICYAWLLENRMRANEQGGGEADANTIEVVVPVMNMTRRKMLKERQAAWLFHLVDIDAKSLLFSDEVDLETLLLSKQLSVLVVGEDILKTNGEVLMAVSGCTILTDNYCEDAYDLLKTPILKKLLFAGILLDTQNLSASSKVSMTRDVEAVQLLSVGSTPNYRNTFFDQLIQDPKDNSFFEAMRQSYGNSPIDSGHNYRAQQVSERNSILQENTPSSDKISKDVKNGKTNRVSPKSGKPKISPVQAPAASPADASRGKNKPFFLAKWFGFGK